MSNYYFIVSKLPPASPGINYAVDIKGGSATVGAALQVYPAKQTPHPDNQLWEPVPDPADSSYFSLRSKLGNFLIAIKGSPSKTGGSPLEIAANPSGSTPHGMLWKAIGESSSTQFFGIQSKLSGDLVMDVKGGSAEPSGTPLQVFPRHGSAENEHWALAPAPGSSFSPKLTFVFNDFSSDITIEGTGFMPFRNFGVIYTFADPESGLGTSGGDGGDAPILVAGTTNANGGALVGTFSTGLPAGESAIGPNSTVNIQVNDGSNIVNLNGIYQNNMWHAT